MTAEKPEDLNLPNTVIARILKESLPDGVNIAKDARVAMSRAATVFVLYVTSTANEIAQQSHKKTITAKEVLEAMKDIDFERFVDPMETTLKAWRLEQQRKKSAAAERKRSRQMGSPTEEINKPDETPEISDDDEDTEQHSPSETTSSTATTEIKDSHPQPSNDTANTEEPESDNPTIDNTSSDSESSDHDVVTIEDDDD